MRRLMVPMLLCLALSTQGRSDPGEIIARTGSGAHPTWSPSGSIIAYQYHGAVYVFCPDGRDEAESITEMVVLGFAWISDSEMVLSTETPPDSDSIIFVAVSLQQERDQTGTVKYSATNERTLVRTLQRRGNRITTGPWRLRDGTVGYYEVAGSTMGPGKFTPFDLPQNSLNSWKAQKRVIARSDSSKYGSIWGNIWLTRIDSLGDPGRQLTSGEDFGFTLLSPQGDKLIALGVDRQSYVIMDTSGNELVSNFERNASILAWSNDGTKVCFVHIIEETETSEISSLAVYNLLTGNTSELLPKGRNYGSASWSPDNRLIAVSTSPDGILVIKAE